MEELQRRRQHMLDRDLRGRGIDDERVLAAMATVPREQFVPPALLESAYADRPLMIGQGQTISQPYIVAFMAQAAIITPRDRVLEVGAGSGYGAAVLGQLALRVDSVERHPSLASTAAERMSRLGYATVRVHEGDGTLGWPAAAPFDVVVVTAAGPELPAPLLEQLRPGGRLVMPVERRHGHQQLLRVTKDDAGTLKEESLLGVAFVPLIGEHGRRRSK